MLQQRKIVAYLEQALAEATPAITSYVAIYRAKIEGKASAGQLRAAEGLLSEAERERVDRACRAAGDAAMFEHEVFREV